jgi:predicted Zn-dependent protease
MAKVRRTAPKPTPRKKTQPARHRRTVGKKASVAAAPAVARTPTPPEPPHRPRYEEAVAIYEAGLKALQLRQFTKARDLLQSLIDRFPDERELHERARLYLRVCERQIEEAQAQPRSASDRVTAATVALNAGRTAEAISSLRSVVQEDSKNDHAEYVLAVGYATLGDSSSAISHLARAIALNPENRSLARSESDFDSLRHDPAFRSLLDQADARRRPVRKFGR